MMLKLLGTLLMVAALVGCGRKGPPELTLEQVPPALRNAFANAKIALMRKNAESIAALVTDKQYAAAALQLQALSANTDLTDEQRNVVGAATITVNRTLQELAASIQPTAEAVPTQAQPAAAPPNKEEAAAAAAVLQHYIQTK
jgi:predicted small lipoprotein YifL